MKSFFLFSLFHIALFSYQYTLCVSAIFKDEAPYLKEWIEYHKLMGAQHFRLYNNESVDDYLTVLKPYIENKEVIVINWPNRAVDLKSWPLCTQLPSCLDAICYYRGKTKWLALIDIDEFLFPIKKKSMVAFLKDFESYPGVVLNWQCFGTSHVEDLLPNQLMIEALTLKAKENDVHNLPVKSIVRPECVDLENTAWPPHTFCYLDNRFAVDAEKEKRSNLDDYPPKNKVCTKNAVINHYVHRTERAFWNEKIPKKICTEPDVINPVYVENWRNSCNATDDFRIQRFVPILRKKVFPN